MTKYFTAWDDFDIDTIGSAIAGWTDRIGLPTKTPAYAASTALAFKRRYLSLTIAGGSVGATSFNAVDSDANAANFDIVTSIATDLTTAQIPVIYARGQTSASWYRLRLTMSGSIQIDKSVATVVTNNINSSSVSVSFSAAHIYLIRWRGNGTSLKVKVWDASLGMAGEPAAWNLTTTDSSLSAPGWIGLGTFHASLSGKISPFNFFSVGTNGDSAACPRTNAEYTAWLGKQTAQRAVVAKMRCTGDDSATPRKVYIANYGYTSQEQDSPSFQHFDNFIVGLPSFSRLMPAALSGQAVVNFGKMQVRNNFRIDKDGDFFIWDDGSNITDDNGKFMRTDY